MADFKIWMNGRLVPGDQAVLPVNSAAVFYATNVFEGLRAYWNAAASSPTVSSSSTWAELFERRQDRLVEDNFRAGSERVVVKGGDCATGFG